MLVRDHYLLNAGSIAFRVYEIERRSYCPEDLCFAGPQMQSDPDQQSQLALALTFDRRRPS